jgi:hypothetical protein
LGWVYADSMLFVVHAPVRPEDAHWSEFMSDVRAQRGLKGVIIKANNSRLNPLQRAEIQGFYEERKVRGALLTDSMMMRGIVTAMNWFKVELRAFAPEDLDGAFAFVGVAPNRFNHAKAVLLELEHGVSKVAARAVS